MPPPSPETTSSLLPSSLEVSLGGLCGFWAHSLTEGVNAKGLVHSTTGLCGIRAGHLEMQHKRITARKHIKKIRCLPTLEIPRVVSKHYRHAEVTQEMSVSVSVSVFPSPPSHPGCALRWQGVLLRSPLSLFGEHASVLPSPQEISHSTALGTERCPWPLCCQMVLGSPWPGRACTLSGGSTTAAHASDSLPQPWPRKVHLATADFPRAGAEGWGGRLGRATAAGTGTAQALCWSVSRDGPGGW